MKVLLRSLLLLHLRRPLGLWIILGIITLGLGWGVLRVERRLDLMSLLPTDHPVVRASLEAGVGQQELLWIVAEGNSNDLEQRRAWAESMVERLLEGDTMPLNGLAAEGRLAAPVPVPERKGVSLWPTLLAAGSFFEGDAAVGRLLTEQFYAVAPLVLGDRLDSLTNPEEVRARLKRTAKALASPEPVKARLAQLDPLELRSCLPSESDTVDRSRQSAKAFPLRLHTGYLETKDDRYVLLPLVLDFPSGDAKATGRILNWLGNGAKGSLSKGHGLADVTRALAASADRPFAIQATGAHAIAYYESQRLTREVLMALGLSFVLIGLVYWLGFRTLAGYGFVVVPLLLGMVWALGMVGWILGHLNLMAAAFGAVLLGIGDDVGILLFSRYRDERMQGSNKAFALRAALMGTGPGVIAGALATALAFLACAAAPFPGFRDLGLTAGLGLIACLASSFLVLPALLLGLDRGKGAFAPKPEAHQSPKPLRRWKPWLAFAVFLLALWGARRLTWEEDLRRFRQKGNPALAMQETLGKVLGAGLQPLAIQIPMDSPDTLPSSWNRIATALSKEGVPMPAMVLSRMELRRILGSDTWLQMVLRCAAEEGLDPTALERPLEALRASAENPLAAPRTLQALLAPAKMSAPPQPWTLMGWFHKNQTRPMAGETFTLPLRLSEAAQDRVEPEIQAAGARMVGTRPLFRAVKEVAREALRDIILLAFAAVALVIAIFGRRVRFVALALVPLIASQAGALGILGWCGEPLTFLSLVAIPIALGVSVDTAMNLLHRARMEPHAAARVARVNAVCAGTTLAGFGGLVFSGYRGLQGLGLACLGGVGLALLVTQWLLPWMIEKWPLRKERT